MESAHTQAMVYERFYGKKVSALLQSHAVLLAPALKTFSGASKTTGFVVLWETTAIALEMTKKPALLGYPREGRKVTNRHILQEIALSFKTYFVCPKWSPMPLLEKQNKTKKRKNLTLKSDFKTDSAELKSGIKFLVYVQLWCSEEHLPYHVLLHGWPTLQVLKQLLFNNSLHS